MPPSIGGVGVPGAILLLPPLLLGVAANILQSLIQLVLDIVRDEGIIPVGGQSLIQLVLEIVRDEGIIPVGGGPPVISFAIHSDWYGS